MSDLQRIGAKPGPLTDREKWLMQKAFHKGWEIAFQQRTPDLAFKYWISHTKASGISIGTTLAEEAPE